MFHDEYYPTPAPVIERMLRPWLHHPGSGALKMDGLRVLEPSAGTGDILRYIQQHTTSFSAPAALHAVEVNATCRHALNSLQGVSLVGDDILRFDPDEKYDLAVMNPPFAQGVKHLLHVWERCITSGDVVCLLNAESIRNPCNRDRELLAQLIAAHGSVEFLGPVFQGGERPTEVHVVLVRLAKVDRNDPFSFWQDAYFRNESRALEFAEEAMGNEVAVNDVIAAMVAQYRAVQPLFVEYLRAYRRLQYHVKNLSIGTHRPFDELLQDAVRYKEHPAKMVEAFMRDLRMQAWDSVVERTAIHDLMSSSVRSDFKTLQEEQRVLDFTEENIRALFSLLFENRHRILQRSVEESFDLMTRYHKENRVHVEGWLSNDAFKVNRKVVLPGMVSAWLGTRLSVSDHGKRTILDIDRGVAMVEGRKISGITTMARALDAKLATTPLRGGAIGDNTCTSTYFHIRFFKKGTIHITFLDEGLWERFNRTAAQLKKWLPMDHTRKPANEPDAATPQRGAQFLLNA